MEKEKIKTLKFTCPECGSNELGSIENVLTIFPITRILEDGDADYGDSRTDDSTIVAYECVDCGYQLQGDFGATIIDILEMVEWVKKHCSQN